MDDGPACDSTLPAPASVPAVAILAETGNDKYVPLEPDQVLVRHSGPQGGQHFWLRVRVFAADDHIWSFDADLTSSGGASLASGSRGVTACPDVWTNEREITVFLEQFGTEVTGTLNVAASSPPDSFSIQAPISVP